MPITPFLDSNTRFDPEIIRVMGVAFEATCAALRLSDRADPFTKVIAEKIIELALDGEPNPDLLCERTLKALRGA